MATQTDSLSHSLVELGNRMAGKYLQKVLLKLAENALLKALLFKECNLGVQHKESTFENLPVARFGALGGFYPSIKSTSRQVIEEASHMKGYANIAVDIAQASGNPALYRYQEQMAIVEGIGQDAVEKILYGDRDTNPFEPRGLIHRLNALSMANVLDAGGTVADDGLTSIYVAKMDDQAFFGLYRQGFQAGLKVRDLGEKTQMDTDTGEERQVYKTLFEWDMGIMIRDPRCVYRIANVPVPNSMIDETAFAKFNHMIIKALNKIPGRKTDKFHIFMNSDVLTMFDIMNYNKGNANYTVDNIDGVPVSGFRKVPIGQTDGILSTEDQVA